MFPHRYRYLGWILILAGIVLTIFYVNFDFRLTMPVFAVFSHFMEMKFFTSYNTNVADELLLICLLAGFFILVYSKDKEPSALKEQVKGNVLFRSFFYNNVFLLFSILFIYGQGFFVVLVLNMFSTFIIYLVLYRHAMYKISADPEHHQKNDARQE